MPVQLSFQIEGEQQVSRILGIAAVKVSNYREPLGKSAEEIKRVARLNIKAGGGLFGGWPPRKKPYPWPIMYKTGKLYGAFTSTTTAFATDVGNQASYFKYHQSLGARSHLPRRVLLKLNEGLKTFIIKEFQAYIQKAASGQGA